MPDILIYQTSDPNFAETAVVALLAEGIACYRVGQGVARLNAPGRRLIADNVSVFIRDAEDYQRANTVLRGLGAIVEAPIRAPKTWVVMIVVAILVALVLALTL